MLLHAPERPQARRAGAPIERVDVLAYEVPTDFPESDGTLAWKSTTMVLVEVRGGGRVGFGFTYADQAAARFVSEHLARAVAGINAMDVAFAWEKMRAAARNMGRLGPAAMAISAVDIADGFSCREQIRQSTGRRALHLAQVLSLAAREGEVPV